MPQTVTKSVELDNRFVKTMVSGKVKARYMLKDTLSASSVYYVSKIIICVNLSNPVIMLV